MIPEEIYQKILRSAVSAPSGHNTQAWRFRKTVDGLSIQPDYSRTLPIADPEHRELYISLGCAAETAMIAAQFYGYHTQLQLHASKNECIVNISLQKSENLAPSQLYPFIKLRQTTRNLYDSRPIPSDDLQQLLNSNADESTDIKLFTSATERKQFGSFIAEAVAIQMSQRAYKQELIDWMRFSEKEALLKGDGLYTACSGVPSMGRMAGSFIIRNFVNAKTETKRLIQQLDNTAAVAILSGIGDSNEARIQTGRTLQRFALTATMLNINHSYLNPPCQVQSVREKLRLAYCTDTAIPQIILRLGYSKKMPYALHKGISSLNYQS